MEYHPTCDHAVCVVEKCGMTHGHWLMGILIFACICFPFFMITSPEEMVNCALMTFQNYVPNYDFWF